MIHLTNYDWIVVNSSAGKDSQAMLHWVVTNCREQSISLQKVVVAHADLDRMEWKGTKELVAEHAAHYGLRFEVRKNRQRDLLQAVRERGMWPSNTCRYCTSDFKRAQMRRLFTALTDEWIGEEWGHVPPRGCRILNCMGMRAEESPKRAKLEPFSFCKQASNGKRKVWDWLPIHSWTEEDVWAIIKEAGTRSHYAYGLGMPRLSCCFCLAGETEVATRNGIRHIRDIAGTVQPLLVPKMTPYGIHSHGTFVDTEVRSFGTQPLVEITLRRNRQKKTVYATLEHRWLVVAAKLRPAKVDGRHNGYEYVTAERTTESLAVGDKLRPLKAHPCSEMCEVPFAVAQGFVYGDGCKGYGERPCTLAIYDEGKDGAILPYFAKHEFKRSDNRLHVYGLPRLWKEAPDMRESRSFLLSWLAGYFAADGCVSEAGQATISSSSSDSLQIVRDIAAVCGITCSPLTSVSRVGTGTEETTLYRVTLDARDLPEWFFIIESHRQRIALRARTDQERYWTVEAVEKSDRTEEVFCAVVPGAHAFGLSDDLMTGNCIFAPKPALMIAARHNPELLDEYIQVEMEIGHRFRVDLSLAEVKAAVQRGETVGAMTGAWNM